MLLNVMAAQSSGNRDCSRALPTRTALQPCLIKKTELIEHFETANKLASLGISHAAHHACGSFVVLFPSGGTRIRRVDGVGKHPIDTTGSRWVSIYLSVKARRVMGSTSLALTTVSTRTTAAVT